MKKKDQKSRRQVDHVHGLSSWHFANIQSNKDKKINSLEEVNKIGARFATEPENGDAELLIKAFHGYLMKYLKLLTGSSFESGGKYLPQDTKQFLRLFITGGDMSSSQRAEAFRKAAERLPNMAKQSLMSADDIYNELVVIFLQLARKFNPNIGGFTGYIQHHFKFAVKTRLFQIQNDPLNYQPLYEGEFDAHSNDIDNPEITAFENVLRLHVGYTIKDDTIVEQFVDLPILNKGFVSSPPQPFDKLWTKQQRAIIIKIYMEDRSFSAAADDLGYSNTANIRELHDRALQSYRDWAGRKDIK